MEFKLIPNWNTKELTCNICGTDKSVKYSVDVNGKDMSICNKCILTKNEFLEDLRLEQSEQM